MKILIKNANILDIENNKEKIYISDVLIEDENIAKIQMNLNEKADKIIDATGKLLMPGLINTHCHLGMSIFRGYGENKRLMDWLNNYIFPKEKLLTKELVYYFSMLSCIEAIKSGTTFLTDMYFYQNSVVDVFNNIGIRGIVGCGPFDEDINEETIEYIKRKNLGNMISAYCYPHAPYTCDPDRYKGYLEYAKKKGIGIETHLLETQDEVKIIKEKYGKTSTQYLNDIGIFDVPVILAHGIYLNDDDIEILKNINGGIVHNPISNAKLASGVCDVKKLINSGITVGLGTDGASSTSTIDMFEEMKLCGYMQRLKYMDASIISSYDILKMATINNAKIVNKQNEIGSIKVGKKADIILVNLEKSYLTPNLDIVSLLVYSSNSEFVDTTIINGKIVMENRNIKTVNEKEIIKKCNQLAKEFYK